MLRKQAQCCVHNLEFGFMSLLFGFSCHSADFQEKRDLHTFTDVCNIARA